MRYVNRMQRVALEQDARVLVCALNAIAAHGFASKVCAHAHNISLIRPHIDQRVLTKQPTHRGVLLANTLARFNGGGQVRHGSVSALKAETHKVVANALRPPERKEQVNRAQL